MVFYFCKTHGGLSSILQWSGGGASFNLFSKRIPFHVVRILKLDKRHAEFLIYDYDSLKTLVISQVNSLLTCNFSESKKEITINLQNVQNIHSAESTRQTECSDTGPGGLTPDPEPYYTELDNLQTYLYEPLELQSNN